MDSYQKTYSNFNIPFIKQSENSRNTNSIQKLINKSLNLFSSSIAKIIFRRLIVLASLEEKSILSTIHFAVMEPPLWSLLNMEFVFQDLEMVYVIRSILNGLVFLAKHWSVLTVIHPRTADLECLRLEPAVLMSQSQWPEGHIISLCRK